MFKNLPLFWPHWHFVLDRCVVLRLSAEGKSSRPINLKLFALTDVLAISVFEFVLILYNTVCVHWLFCHLMLRAIRSDSVSKLHRCILAELVLNLIWPDLKSGFWRMLRRHLILHGRAALAGFALTLSFSVWVGWKLHVALVRVVIVSCFSILSHAVKFITRDLLHVPVMRSGLVMLIEVSAATIIALEMEVGELEWAILVLMIWLVSVAFRAALGPLFVVCLVVSPLALSVHVVFDPLEVFALVLALAALSLLISQLILPILRLNWVDESFVWPMRLVALHLIELKWTWWKILRTATHAVRVLEVIWSVHVCFIFVQNFGRSRDISWIHEAWNRADLVWQMVFAINDFTTIIELLLFVKISGLSLKRVTIESMRSSLCICNNCKFFVVLSVGRVASQVVWGLGSCLLEALAISRNCDWRIEVLLRRHKSLVIALCGTERRLLNPCRTTSPMLILFRRRFWKLGNRCSAVEVARLWQLGSNVLLLRTILLHWRLWLFRICNSSYVLLWPNSLQSGIWRNEGVVNNRGFLCKSLSLSLGNRGVAFSQWIRGLKVSGTLGVSLVVVVRRVIFVSHWHFRRHIAWLIVCFHFWLLIYYLWTLCFNISQILIYNNTYFSQLRFCLRYQNTSLHFT